MNAEVHSPPGVEWLLGANAEDIQKRLAALGRAQLVSIILVLLTWIVGLQGRHKDLSARLSLNSRNSSQPPSTDGYEKPAPKSLRQRTGRKTGGQPGHEGVTLQMVKKADHYEMAPLPKKCHCGLDLSLARQIDVITRQVFDLAPPLPKPLEVTEFKALVVACACGCVHQGQFPSYVTQPTQYGPRLAARVAYYNQRQLLPYERLQETLVDLHGVEVSEGTIKNILHRGYDYLAPHDENVVQALTTSPIAGFDSTGMRVMKETWWLHVARTEKLTFYHIDPHNGEEAMDAAGILPHFSGIAVHDGCPTYFRYPCHHALCNAHHLRELTFAQEQFEQTWAGQLKELLLQANIEVRQAKAAGGRALARGRVQYYSDGYTRILERGPKELPASPPRTGKRGRPKKHKVVNLYERLLAHKQQALSFMSNFNIPFTNNGSEQDARVSKVKQKISGCFRSEMGAKIFARFRGYISCSIKQGINVLEALTAVFENDQKFIRRLSAAPDRPC